MERERAPADAEAWPAPTTPTPLEEALRKLVDAQRANIETRKDVRDRVERELQQIKRCISLRPLRRRPQVRRGANPAILAAPAERRQVAAAMLARSTRARGPATAAATMRAPSPA